MRLFNISTERKHQIGNILFTFITNKFVFWLGAAFSLFSIEYNPLGIDKHPIIIGFGHFTVYVISWGFIAALVMLLDVED